ncbi:hypothetical protein CALCODRAFT_511310 [Calocera cornea HHB12733]|uniref:F-box domain-containing protein n=1 Tax=Calocera cornea HHB12733 TaxID=1353952 RepID=A0A165DV26_9BASI|nr:hypothetical protein CALCODRAFT_511310 [Calocera cornea HHB12733]
MSPAIQRMSPHPFLPAELVDSIAAYAKESDLYSFCLVNRGFNRMGERYLYRSCNIGLCLTLLRRPSLAQWVRSLSFEVTHPWHGEDWQWRKQPIRHLSNSAIRRLYFRTIYAMTCLTHMTLYFSISSKDLLCNFERLTCRLKSFTFSVPILAIEDVPIDKVKALFQQPCFTSVQHLAIPYGTHVLAPILDWLGDTPLVLSTLSTIEGSLECWRIACNRPIKTAMTSKGLFADAYGSELKAAYIMMLARSTGPLISLELRLPTLDPVVLSLVGQYLEQLLTLVLLDVEADSVLDLYGAKSARQLPPLAFRSLTRIVLKDGRYNPSRVDVSSPAQLWRHIMPFAVAISSETPSLRTLAFTSVLTVTASSNPLQSVTYTSKVEEYRTTEFRKEESGWSYAGRQLPTHISNTGMKRPLRDPDALSNAN